jgi:transcriptional regulator with XRE-family HTH domain
MSTAASHLHPLIVRLRDAVAREDYLTQEQMAAEIGVSTRTLSYWLSRDTTPQKRYRKRLADWLAQAEAREP